MFYGHFLRNALNDIFVNWLFAIICLNWAVDSWSFSSEIRNSYIIYFYLYIYFFIFCSFIFFVISFKKNGKAWEKNWLSVTNSFLGKKKENEDKNRVNHGEAFCEIPEFKIALFSFSAESPENVSLNEEYRKEAVEHLFIWLWYKSINSNYSSFGFVNSKGMLYLLLEPRERCIVTTYSDAFACTNSL